MRYRTLLLPGTTTGPTLSVITQHFVVAQPDCATTTEAIGTVAIAGVPLLAGTPLATSSAVKNRVKDWPRISSG